MVEGGGLLKGCEQSRPILPDANIPYFIGSFATFARVPYWPILSNTPRPVAIAVAKSCSVKCAIPVASGNLSDVGESDSSPSGLQPPVGRLVNSHGSSAPAACWGRSIPWISGMTEHPTGGISGVDPLRAIDLIWTLRDIKAKAHFAASRPDHATNCSSSAWSRCE